LQLHHQKRAFLLRVVFGHGARGKGGCVVVVSPGPSR
jgi:hypothetical protein